MKKTLGALLTVVVCIGGLAALQLPRLRSHLATADIDSEMAQAEEAVQRDRLQLWKTMPVFGFDNLVADWAFLNFLQYFGYSEARDVTGYSAVPDFFEVMVQRDPYFRLSYRFLSSAVTLFAGQPEETVRLLEMGLAHMTPTFPEDSYWLWKYKAVDEMLFLGDTEAAIASHEKAAEWASQSPDPRAEQAGQNSRSTAEFLRQDPNNRQVQMSSWLMIWSNGINEEVRQYAQSQIEALGYRVVQEGDRLRIEDTQAPPAEAAPPQE